MSPNTKPNSPITQDAPRVIRQLSDTYRYQGRISQDDPDSYDKPEQLRERFFREHAILRDMPLTGYATGIKQRRDKLGYGFFKPYEDLTDLKDTLIAPIVEPIYLGFLCIDLTMQAVYSSLGFLLHTAAAFCVYLFDKDEAAYQIYSAKLAFGEAKNETTAILVTALTALLAWAHGLLKLITRSGSSIVDAMIMPHELTEDEPLQKFDLLLP